MRDVLADVGRWRARGERVALATVVATRESAPRPVGSRLAVSESGAMAGSVSGGCVESEVVGEAAEVLAGGAPRLLTYGIADDVALGVGLPCGGEIDVLVAEPAEEVLARIEGVVEREERAVLFTVVDGERTGAQLLVTADGERVGEGPDEAAGRTQELLRGGRSRVVELADGTRVLAELLGPPPRLLVFGAVDTAEALCHAAGLLGWRTVVADARARFASPERLPSADEVLAVWPDEALARVRPDGRTAVVVLTHDERFDVPALAGALRSDAFYVGALGSRRAQELRRERLREAGVSEADLERLAGPAGLDVGADTPAETAISILAEILAARAGRAGGRLREAAGRIHVE